MLERFALLALLLLGLGLLWAAVAFGARYRRWRRVDRMCTPELSQGKTTVLFFTGEQCSVCHHRQKPALDVVCSSHNGDLRVVELDAARETSLVRRFGVPQPAIDSRARGGWDCRRCQLRFRPFRPDQRPGRQRRLKASFSALSLYAACPLKYRYLQVDGQVEPPVQPDWRRAPTSAELALSPAFDRELGIAVHRALARWQRAVDGRAPARASSLLTSVAAEAARQGLAHVDVERAMERLGPPLCDYAEGPWPRRHTLFLEQPVRHVLEDGACFQSRAFAPGRPGSSIPSRRCHPRLQNRAATCIRDARGHLAAANVRVGGAGAGGRRLQQGRALHPRPARRS